MLCAKFSWNWYSQVVLEKRIFNFVNVFSLFRNNIPLEKGRTLQLNKLEPHHTKMVWAKFGWNWINGSGEEDFLNDVNVFSLFRNYFPLEKGGVLLLNKLESPLSKDALCQVWLKLAQWSGGEDFLNSWMYFCYFIIISPWKRAGFFIEDIWIPFTQGGFEPRLVEIGSVVLEKKIF